MQPENASKTVEEDIPAYDIEDYRDLISGLRPINLLPAQAINRLMEKAVIEDYPVDNVILKQGEVGEFVHYIVEGCVDFLWNNESETVMRAGTKVPLRRLNPGTRKIHELKAVQPCALVTIPRDILESLLLAHVPSELPQDLEVRDIELADTSDVMVTLLQSSLFSQMPATSIQKVFDKMEPQQLDANEAIVNQGDDGHYFYVVVAGTCEVRRKLKQNQRDISLRDLRPGNTFGESALITGQKRDATVTALSPVELIKLKATDFKEIILKQLIKDVSYEDAIVHLDGGAEWLDVREPNEHLAGSFPKSQNISLNLLRLHVKNLSPEITYIICGDSAEETTLGAFILAERGFEVLRLESTVAKCEQRFNAEVVKAANTDGVVAIPGSREVAADAGGSDLELPQAEIDHDPLSETLRGREVGGSPRLDNDQGDASTAEAQPAPASSGDELEFASALELEFDAEETVNQMGGAVQLAVDEFVAREQSAADGELELTPEKSASADLDVISEEMTIAPEQAETELEPTAQQPVDVDLDAARHSSTTAQVGAQHASEGDSPNVPAVAMDIESQFESEPELQLESPPNLDGVEDSGAVPVPSDEHGTGESVEALLAKQKSKLQVGYLNKFKDYQRQVEGTVQAHQLKWKANLKAKQLALREQSEKIRLLADKVRAEKQELDEARANLERDFGDVEAVRKEIEQLKAELAQSA